VRHISQGAPTDSVCPDVCAIGFIHLRLTEEES